MLGSRSMETKIRLRGRSVLLLISAYLGGAPVSTHAKEERFPVSTVSPSFPDRLLAKRIEGWVEATFRVSAAGSVEGAFVSDSSGQAAMDRAVLSAVSRWTYEPASSDRCGERIVMTLQLVKSSQGPSASFTKRFEAARALTRSEKLDEAQRALEKLSPRALTEVAMKFLAEADLAGHRGDLEAEEIALYRAFPEEPATALEDPVAMRRFRESITRSPLSAETIVGVLRRRFDVLVEAHRYGDALRLVRALRAAEAMTPEIDEVVTQLAALPDGTRRVETPGRVQRRAAMEDAPSTWMASLLRESVRIEPSAGAIDRVEVCCPDAMATARPGELIRVPGPPTECHVRVFAEEGAKFRLVELPNAPASAHAAESPAP